MYYTSKSVYEAVAQVTQDTILERKTCALTGNKFPVTQREQDFLKKVSPTFGDSILTLQTPTLCPEERQRRRLLWRNEKKLYRRTCDATGDSIISMYHADSNYTVYNTKYRWSDNWSPLEYGVSYDLTKSFTQQFDTLMKRVPRVAVFNDMGMGSSNSEYTNDVNFVKDCYLVFSSWNSQNCLYCSGSCNQDSYVVDCNFVSNSERVYGSTYGDKLFNCTFLTECKDSSNCHYSRDLVGCTDCIGCYGLVNATNHILNKKYSKEEYKVIKDQLMASPEKFKKVIEYLENAPRPATKNINGDTVFGNHLFQSKDAVFCYDATNINDCKYFYAGSQPTYCMDVENSGSPELCYECSTPDESQKVAFSFFAWNSKNSYYLDTCRSVSNCFGCIGLRGNAEYCILNKQYTKEDYEKLVPQIITKMQQDGERGEFFHPSLSPFAYNETVAQEYFTLTEEEVIQKGYTRYEDQSAVTVPVGVETLIGEQIPTDVSTVGTEILKKVLICEDSGKPYRIVKAELEFYQRHQLPLPRKHPDVRNDLRMANRPERALYMRTCDSSGQEILSVYPQDYKNEVYATDIYQKVVVG